MLGILVAKSSIDKDDNSKGTTLEIVCELISNEVTEVGIIG